MRAPWLFSDLDCAVTHGPLIGQDNDDVLETLLGLCSRRARPTSGGTPLTATTENEEIRIGLVAGGDARRTSALEDLPIDSLWVGGHVASRNPSPEAMMSLARLAALTERVKVGTSILLLPLYPPALVAKQIADLDRVTERACRSSALASAGSTRRSSAPARCRSKNAAAAPTR